MKCFIQMNKVWVKTLPENTCKRQATSKDHMCSDFSLFAPHFCSVIIANRKKQGWGCHASAKTNFVWFLALVPKWPCHFAPPIWEYFTKQRTKKSQLIRLYFLFHKKAPEARSGLYPCSCDVWRAPYPFQDVGNSVHLVVGLVHLEGKSFHLFSVFPSFPLLGMHKCPPPLLSTCLW